MSKRRVLFLCNANSARSLMGEVLLRHMAGDRFESFSAGSEPDEPHALTLEALKKQGLSTEGLHSKSLDQFENEAFDVVIVLCDKAQQACRDWEKGVALVAVEQLSIDEGPPARGVWPLEISYLDYDYISS